MPPPIRLPLSPLALFSSSPSPASFLRPAARAYWTPASNARSHPRVLERLGRSPPTAPQAIARTQSASHSQGASWGRLVGVSVGAVGLMGLWKASGGGRNAREGVWCQPQATPPPPPPEAESIVNPYELTFGAVCGICAGVFIKKGAKALAFVLGGLFVLFQYLSSIDILKVNWSRLSSSYGSLTSTPSDTPGGQPIALTVTRLWSWVVDFLTRDFQQRASFIGGLALGLRVG